MARYISLLFVVFFASACWEHQVEEAAHATALIDQQVAAAYATHAKVCLSYAGGWDEYDVCMAVWNKAAVNVSRLRETTLALDVAHGRKARKAAACEWFRIVDRLPPLPAVAVAQQHKWRRKC